MKSKFLLLVLTLLVSAAGQAQTRVRLPVWTFHQDSARIYGLSLGLTSNEKKRQVVSTGIHVELLGLGIIFPMLGRSPLTGEQPGAPMDRDRFSEKVYGLNISPLGTFTDNLHLYGVSINGVSSLSRYAAGITLAGLYNYARTCYGVQASLLGNEDGRLYGIQAGLFNTVHDVAKGLQLGAVNASGSHTGLQVGLFNRARRLKGLQLGIWNVNEKRKLPLVNW
ncbi:MAG TPA: hypothetical protein VHK69_02715 [Chitinophagaceae bacterium]|jgi:hypothetical protein|nr:hypothetical protein [Chitinophagaceae bacterium]